MYMYLESIAESIATTRTVENVLNPGMTWISLDTDFLRHGEGSWVYHVNIVDKKKPFAQIQLDLDGAVLCVEYYVYEQTPATLPHDKKYIFDIVAEDGNPVFDLSPWDTDERFWDVWPGETPFWYEDDLVVLLGGDLGRIDRKICLDGKTDILIDVESRFAGLVYRSISKNDRALISLAHA